VQLAEERVERDVESEQAEADESEVTEVEQDVEEP